MAEKTLNLRGLKCPLPALRAKKALTSMAAGDLLTIYEKPNIVTLTGPQLILPPGRSRYFIGVIVDPNNTITELRDIGVRSNPALFPFRRVGPPIVGLPAAGIVRTPPTPPNLFPTPPFGPIVSPLNPATTPTTVTGASVSGTRVPQGPSKLAAFPYRTGAEPR